jgi:hypothetical protein
VTSKSKYSIGAARGGLSFCSPDWRQVILGQADDLGGGVFKKRIRKNQYCSIILARTDHYWIYEYLFAKRDRANIKNDERSEFRKLVKVSGGLTTHQMNQLIREND